MAAEAAPQRDQSAPPASGRDLVLGRYARGPVIGRGGMSSVYRGEDVVSGRPVAIKVLAPHLSDDPVFRQRLLHEALAVERLPHPHIVRVLDAGATSGGDDDALVLVMELVEGQTLQQRLAAGPLPVADASEIAAQIAEALAYAHVRGIVHRDVKPANILLRRPTAERGKPYALLADFSIARSADATATLTATGTVMGSAPYVAPELLQGRPADARSDLYALGATLFQSLTGQYPFAAATPAAALSRRLVTDPPPVQRLRPDVPAWLAEVTARLLAREPAARFVSAGDAAQALRQTAMATEPLIAPPAWRWNSALPAATTATRTIPAVPPTVPIVRPRQRTTRGEDRARQWVLSLPLLALCLAFVAVAGIAASGTSHRSGAAPAPDGAGAAPAPLDLSPTPAATETPTPPTATPQPSATAAPPGAVPTISRVAPAPAPARAVPVTQKKREEHDDHGDKPGKR